MEVYNRIGDSTDYLNNLRDLTDSEKCGYNKSVRCYIIAKLILEQEWEVGYEVSYFELPLTKIVTGGFH